MYFRIANLSSKGQLVIPRDLRERMGFKKGTKMGMVTEGRNILLTPLREPELATFQELIDETHEIIRRATAGKRGKKCTSR